MALQKICDLVSFKTPLLMSTSDYQLFFYFSDIVLFFGLSCHKGM